MTFDLTREAWIPVLNRNLQVSEVSLATLFENPRAFVAIAGENPPVTLALQRFLLALIHRAHRGPKTPEHWAEIRANGSHAVLQYLEEHREQFDLRHPTQPFMQDPELGEAQAAPVYVSASWQAANTSTVFSHAHKWRRGKLTPAEAARTLLRLHAVDVPGLKSGHPEGGSNRAAVCSALLNSLNVWVLGEDLWETLMLNLTEYDGINSAPFGFKEDQDLPAWERPLTRPNERVPKGPVDMLTFLYRRVRLVWKEAHVVGIAVTKGDSLPKNVNTAIYEWALPTLVDPQAKPGKSSIRPVRASLKRQVWRDAPALVQSARHQSPTKLHHRSPILIEWLARLSADGLIANRLRIQVISVVTDPKHQAKPLSWHAQALSLPLCYLNDHELWLRLHDAVELADRYEECLRTSKGSPYYVLGAALKGADQNSESVKPDPKILAAFDDNSRYWSALEAPFLELMSALPESDDPLALEEKWEETLVNTVRSAFEASISGIANRRATAMGQERLEQQLAVLKKSSR